MEGRGRRVHNIIMSCIAMKQYVIILSILYNVGSAMYGYIGSEEYLK